MAMSLGRRKKNSTSLAGSMTVRSRDSCRCRYPASISMAVAGSDRVPLFGTATRSMALLRDRFEDGEFWRRVGLQMSVDLLQPDPATDHDHLDPVQQLGNLKGQRVVALVFCGQPHLAGLLDQFLALCVHTGVQRGHGARALRTGHGSLAQLGEQRVEGLHGDPFSQTAHAGPAKPGSVKRRARMADVRHTTDA